MVEAFRQALRFLPLDIIAAHDGANALDVARTSPVDLLLVDQQLPDMSGLELIHALRSEHREIRFVVVSSDATVPLVVEAMTMGALTVLEKQLGVDALLAGLVEAVWPSTYSATINGRDRAALGAAARPESGEASTLSVGRRSAAERWALFVTVAVRSEEDPKTIEDWAREANVSRAVLSECCRAVRVVPHAARDFARMLRSICNSGKTWLPETMLDFGDVRTLNKLLEQAGLEGRGGTPTPTVQEFLERQRWIPKENAGLIALRDLLRRSG